MNGENNRHGGLTQEKHKIIEIVSDLLHGDRRPNAVKPPPVYTFGEDARGDPGVWIYFTIDEDMNPSATKINELNDFAKLVTDSVIEADLGIWPHIQYVDKRFRDLAAYSVC